MGAEQSLDVQQGGKEMGQACFKIALVFAISLTAVACGKGNPDDTADTASTSQESVKEASKKPEEATGKKAEEGARKEGRLGKVGQSCEKTADCEERLVCLDQKCCLPNCDGKECGSDGCGGACGACSPSKELCVDGHCKCQPNCSGKQCGLEPVCGESCGTCGVEETCQDGKCIGASTGDTWKDSVSSLTWQITPTGGEMEWEKATAYCAGLELGGGGWRLPDIGLRGCPAAELGSNTCKVKPGDCLKFNCSSRGQCGRCSENGGPADGCYWPDEMEGQCTWYWSSSPVEGLGSEHPPSHAWIVNFDQGYVSSFSTVQSDRAARCVR